MASLIFAHAKAALKEKKKLVNDLRRIHGDEFDTSKFIDNFKDRKLAEFGEILEWAEAFRSVYEERLQRSAINWYFVTIRPKPGINFYELYSLVHKFVNRAFMKEFTLTFEQKDPEGTGKGFHCHIVCNTSHRSKGELLRDTKSTFNKICADNCIDVKTTKNPKDIINNYMIAYKSDDDHKIETKNGDAIWRTKMGIADIYENEIDNVRECRREQWAQCKFPESLSSSPETATNSTIIVQLD